MVCTVFQAHRALHHPWIYAYIHKRHHEYKSVISIASEYAHPIEFIFSNAIPFTMVCTVLYYDEYIATCLHSWYYYLLLACSDEQYTHLLLIAVLL